MLKTSSPIYRTQYDWIDLILDALRQNMLFKHIRAVKWQILCTHYKLQTHVKKQVDDTLVQPFNQFKFILLALTLYIWLHDKCGNIWENTPLSCGFRFEEYLLTKILRSFFPIGVLCRLSYDISWTYHGGQIMPPLVQIVVRRLFRREAIISDNADFDKYLSHAWRRKCDSGSILLHMNETNIYVWHVYKSECLFFIHFISRYIQKIACIISSTSQRNCYQYQYGPGHT